MKGESLIRKSNKEIVHTAVIVELLNVCHVGRLGTVGRDGYPMVKPLNFAHCGRKIYFHTAKEGEKIEDIKRDNRVCFEIDLPIAYVKCTASPCRAEYLYRSVIIRGRASLIENTEEKIFALKCLMEKYQPEGEYGNFPEEKLRITGIVRIDIEELIGKENIGKGPMKDQVLKALHDKERLPIVLEQEQ